MPEAKLVVFVDEELPPELAQSHPNLAVLEIFLSIPPLPPPWPFDIKVRIPRSSLLQNSLIVTNISKERDQT